MFCGIYLQNLIFQASLQITTDIFIKYGLCLMLYIKVYIDFEICQRKIGSKRGLIYSDKCQKILCHVPVYYKSFLREALIHIFYRPC